MRPRPRRSCAASLWVTDDLLSRLGRSVPGLGAVQMLRGRGSARVESELGAARRAAEAAGVRGTPSSQAGPTGGRLEPLPISYDAVVLGSAVYAGRWLEPARRIVEEHGDELIALPTWADEIADALQAGEGPAQPSSRPSASA
jgi:hypothetical protein